GANTGGWAAARSSFSRIVQIFAGWSAIWSSIVGGVSFWDPAAVVEQHADRDLGWVLKAADYADGQQRGEPGVERQPPLLGELEHHNGDERLHDAAGAEAIGRAHRCGRRQPTEADHASPGAELGALYVEDRSREVAASAPAAPSSTVRRCHGPGCGAVSKRPRVNVGDPFCRSGRR